jgi:hypothetical protein
MIIINHLVFKCGYKSSYFLRHRVASVTPLDNAHSPKTLLGGIRLPRGEKVQYDTAGKLSTAVLRPDEPKRTAHKKEASLCSNLNLQAAHLEAERQLKIIPLVMV